MGAMFGRMPGGCGGCSDGGTAWVFTGTKSENHFDKCLCLLIVEVEFENLG